jgi:hypothetical protein
MSARFNPPPGWPPPPTADWLPPPGWQPNPSWPIPPGWQLVIEEEAATPAAPEAETVADEEQAEGPPLAEDAGRWWSEIRPAQLHGVWRSGGKDRGLLRVTESGLFWAAPRRGAGHVKIPWATIFKIESGMIQQRQGSQRSAVGFGLLGVAAVGATAVHNAKARKVATHRAFRFTCRDGQVFNFLTDASDAQVEQALGPMFDTYVAEVERHRPPAASQAPGSVAQAGIGIADELTKLAALRDSGVLSAEEFDGQKAKLLGNG